MCSYILLGAAGLLPEASAQNAAKLIQKSKDEIEQLEKDFQTNLNESNFTNDQLAKQKADLHKCMDLSGSLSVTILDNLALFSINCISISFIALF